MGDSGLRRREDDFKLHPETGLGLYPGKDRRQRGPRARKQEPGKEFLRRFRRPIIGLSLVGAAAPLVTAQAKTITSEHPATPIAQPGKQETARRAKEAGLARRAKGDKSAPDTEDLVAAAIGEEVQGAKRASVIGSALQLYNIDEALANDIYDVAMREGIDPKLAFGLVKVESAFKHHAQSGVGARGLTQVMPKTAAWMIPGTSAEDLYDRQTNLTLGFRYLNKLIDKYEGNVHNALTAYNRGPGTVDRVLKRGGDPDNGYAGKVVRSGLS